MPSGKAVAEPFGNRAPFAEPSWYNALASPYYKESHRRVRDTVRRYVDEHIAPNIQEWEENGHVPDEARLRYARAGLAFPELPGEYRGGVPLPGGVPIEGNSFFFFLLLAGECFLLTSILSSEWDTFHSLVLGYELSKIWAAGVSAGLSGGTTIGVPPVIHHGTDEQKKRWLPGIFTGETSFCLGCTEPTG